jgi:hypothetical protein
MSVLSHLQNLASRLNIAEIESEKIDRSINTLYKRLGNYFVNGDLKERFRFGSSVRKTMLPRNADYNSDIDYMIVFENANGYKPQTFISRLKKFAEVSYSKSEIYQSFPTVVLVLGHIKFDLVPSYRIPYWRNLYIPAPRTYYTDWMETDPLSFNIRIDEANKREGFLLKPMIRLLKYWNASNGYIYNSYDLEQKIASMSFSNCANLKDYLFLAIYNLNALDLSGLSEYKRQKVYIAKQIVITIRQYEVLNCPIMAEEEVKKLLPELR